MTQEEINAMAKEAGARSENWATRLFPAVQFLFTPDELSRFAALVAAKERAACADLCEDQDTGQDMLSDKAVIACAAEIRARGQA